MDVLPKLLQRPLLLAAIVVLLGAAVAGSAGAESDQQHNLRPASMTKVQPKYDGMVLPSHLCHVRAPHEPVS